MPLLCLEKAYCLQLANDHVWNLIATEGTGPWVDRLASIMELRDCKLDGHPKLIFINSGKEKHEEPIYALGPDIRGNLPCNGWKTNSRISMNPSPGLQLWYHNDVPDVIFYIGQDERYDKDKHGDRDAIKMWSSVYFIYHREQYFGGLPLHAGLVERDKQGVLLAADGGIGKSTCCSRIPHPWHALADDQTLIICDDQGRYIVHPFPTWSEYLWQSSGKTWDVENHVPLSAIFFLEQAENDEVIPLEKARSAIMINRSSAEAYMIGLRNLDREDRIALRKRVFNNSCELAKAIPAYVLRVSLHGRFWEEIEKVLGNF